VLGWFVGAIVLHDFVLLPLYAVLDRLAAARLGPAVNFVRVPVALSALLALAYFPVLLGKGEAAYARVSALEWHGYLARWAAVSAGLCVVSALVYLVRGRRSAGSSS
jgi:ABC-type transport system involved in cytochrome c biogenesis permease component